MKKLSLQTLQNLELQNQEKNTSSEAKNILALDYGEKFCGFAFSPDGICAFPLEVIETEKIEARTKELLNKKCVQRMVIGLPILPDGKENKLCGIIRELAKKFEPLVSIEFINERYSSKLVLPQKADRIDDFAAVKILEFSFAKK
jgi:RNase H-fold protein (predicted Holliday junction resolvase)